MEKSIELKSAFMTCDGKVIKVKMKENIEVDAEEARAHLRAASELAEGKSFPVMIIDHNFRNFISHEAREIFAHGVPKGWRKKEAIVLSSLPKRILANFYHRFHAPDNPVKIFSNEEDALKWLLE